MKCLDATWHNSFGLFHSKLKTPHRGFNFCLIEVVTVCESQSAHTVQDQSHKHWSIFWQSRAVKQLTNKCLKISEEGSFNMLWWPYATLTICSIISQQKAQKAQFQMTYDSGFSWWCGRDGGHMRKQIFYFTNEQSVPASRRFVITNVFWLYSSCFTTVFLYKYILLLWLDGVDFVIKYHDCSTWA